MGNFCRFLRKVWSLGLRKGGFSGSDRHTFKALNTRAQYVEQGPGVHDSMLLIRNPNEKSHH